jgi:hypothetical protein
MNEVKKFYNSNLMMIAGVMKGVTGVVGASLILSEEHPYMALSALALGAGINEFLLSVEKSRNKNT